MKIAYVHSGRWPSNSPSMTFATMTAYTFSQQTDHCYFFIQKNSELEGNQILKTIFDLPHPENLSIHQIKRNHLINSNKLFYIKVHKYLKYLIKNNELDAVISRNTNFLPCLAEIKEKYGIPTFLESHDFYADISLRNGANAVKRKRARLERKYIPRISGVICLQETQKKLYKNYFPDQRVFVARTGLLDITRNDLRQRLFLGYIGSFDPHKGVLDMVKAAARSKTQPNLLIIGGKTDQEITDFSHQAIQHYDPDKITITGWLNKHTLYQQIKKIKVGVVPLRNTFFNRHLTSPLKLFDYYGHGIPVISSDLPTMRELVDENRTGLFYNYSRIYDMADKIDILFSNEKLYREMVDEVIEKAGTLLWRNRVEKIVDEIRESYVFS